MPSNALGGMAVAMNKLATKGITRENESLFSTKNNHQSNDSIFDELKELVGAYKTAFTNSEGSSFMSLSNNSSLNSDVLNEQHYLPIEKPSAQVKSSQSRKRINKYGSTRPMKKVTQIQVIFLRSNQLQRNHLHVRFVHNMAIR